MIYLKYFEKDADYQQFIDGEEYLLPNVSFVEGAPKVYYNPYTPEIKTYNQILSCIYNVKYTRYSTELLSNSGVTYISDMSIDDVQITPVSSYLFSTSGVHNIQMKLKKGVDNMYQMFSNCSRLTSIDVSDLDISDITNMGNMFSGCWLLSSLISINDWNTSNVTNMRYMFYQCYNLTSLNDISSWDTSKVTDMQNMFACCSGLTSLDLSNWDVNNVTNMKNMFSGCTNLTEIKMGGDVSNVTDVSNMFTGVASTGTFYYNPVYDYSKIIAQLPSDWVATPLYENIKLNGIEIISAENVSGRATKTIAIISRNYSAISLIDGSNVILKHNLEIESSNFEQNVSETEARKIKIDVTYEGFTASTTITQGPWNGFLGLGVYDANSNSSSIKLLGNSGITNSILEMYIDDVAVTPISAYTFSTTGNHNVNIKLKNNTSDITNMFYDCTKLTSLDLSRWDVNKVTNMSNVFAGCEALTTLDSIKDWDVSNVTKMDGMFAACGALTSLDSIKDWDVSKVTDMNRMFYWCTNLTSLDSIKDWDVSNVTNMDKMFSGCTNLTSLDLNSWDTSKVSRMNGMFERCYNLTSLDLSKWDVSNVTEMEFMFVECRSLTSLDLSKWDVSKVRTIQYIFSQCNSLTSLDLTNWDVSNVTALYSMFSYCTKLTNIKGISDWNTSKATKMTYLFQYCTSLTSLDLTKWDTSNVTEMSQMFSNCTSLSELRMGGNVNKLTSVSSMFSYIKTNGTFYYNSLYDYSKIINVLPSTWTAVPCTLVNGELIPNN